MVLVYIKACWILTASQLFHFLGSWCPHSLSPMTFCCPSGSHPLLLNLLYAFPLHCFYFCFTLFFFPLFPQSLIFEILPFLMFCKCHRFHQMVAHDPLMPFILFVFPLCSALHHHLFIYYFSSYLSKDRYFTHLYFCMT